MLFTFYRFIFPKYRNYEIKVILSSCYSSAINYCCVDCGLLAKTFLRLNNRYAYVSSNSSINPPALLETTLRLFLRHKLWAHQSDQRAEYLPKSEDTPDCNVPAILYPTRTISIIFCAEFANNNLRRSKEKRSKQKHTLWKALTIF